MAPLTRKNQVENYNRTLEVQTSIGGAAQTLSDRNFTRPSNRANALLRAGVVLALTTVSLFPTTASATIISSSPFSLGYGFIRVSSGVGQWDTSETSGANTAITIGDFTFSPALTGTMFSNTGPVFPSRTLTNGGTEGVGRHDTFLATVTGSWAGTVPDNHLVSLRLNIDSVRIHAAGFTTVTMGDPNIAFSETTVGHLSTSPALGPLTIIPAIAGFATASNYQQLTWNPDDFDVEGLSSVRTFALVADDIRAIDGFEVLGTIDVILTPVPEPSSLLLLGLGVLGLVRHTRRHRERA